LTCYGAADEFGNCPDGQNEHNGCCCTGETPIVIDVLGNGFNLTDAANGVRFDLDTDGYLEELAWTKSDSDDAWLVLDRNGNGRVDNGAELFGNRTPQTPPGLNENWNGFRALAEYDKPGHGGNADGFIEKNDAVFQSLRLWQDTNHNGLSEVSELHTLPEMGLESIDLDYKNSKYVDDEGNYFRWRAKVRDSHDSQLGHWAWDVILVRGQ